MVEVGVTGGIGSGKSIVCRIFKSLGIPVYDADSQAKILMRENPEIIKAIKSAFGNNSYSEDDKINRDFLAESVFSSVESTNRINSIVHPVVAKDYSTWLSKQNASYVIKEAALLIESGSYELLDKLIVVTAPLSLRIERIKSRDPFRSEKEIMSIIDKQLSDSVREGKADFILKNNESELLIEQVLKLDKYFKELHESLFQ